MWSWQDHGNIISDKFPGGLTAMVTREKCFVDFYSAQQN